MKKAVFRYVEAELYDYPYTKRDIESIREDIIESGRTLEGFLTEALRLGTIPCGGTPSDPTAHKAIRLLTNRRLKRMEETVAAIERVLARLPAEKKRLVELKYWDGRYTDKGIIQQLNISERTYYRWRREIVLAVAIEMGLVNAVQPEAEGKLA